MLQDLLPDIVADDLQLETIFPLQESFLVFFEMLLINAVLIFSDDLRDILCLVLLGQVLVNTLTFSFVDELFECDLVKSLGLCFLWLIFISPERLIRFSTGNHCGLPFDTFKGRLRKINYVIHLFENRLLRQVRIASL